MQYGAISIDPETMGGTPVFAGTRVPIQTLFDYLEGGDSLDEFLEDYAHVSRVTTLKVIQGAGKTGTTEKEILRYFASLVK